MWVRSFQFYSTLSPVNPEPAAGSSIVRALRVVEAVAAAGDGVTAKAIARRLGSPLPTIYRALGILVDEGYLVRLHDVRGYGLGYRVAELQRGLLEQMRPPAGVRSILYEVHTARPGGRLPGRAARRGHRRGARRRLPGAPPAGRDAGAASPPPRTPSRPAR